MTSRDERTTHALREILRLAEVGRRFAARGHDWYVSDPDNAPGLAAESLIIKVGENVARVSDELRSAHPEVPWRVIKDMRNRLAHYDQATDYEVVWNTIDGDFPQIAEMIGRILGSTDPHG
ncbi:hypothetical protein GCM10022237_39150 [Nocardioides ginsengisoli]|uniref:DUF86 domain-containing protein n=1 Tax=Nocardioides ginsengisoli TaxID=363868 RepID=A0ABW3W0H1_9ACTN